MDRPDFFLPAVPQPSSPYQEKPYSTLGAAQRREGLLPALERLVSRPTFEPNDDFDLEEAFKEHLHLRRNRRRDFAGVRSQEEFDYRRQMIEEEMAADRQLEAAGAAGVLAQVAVGVLSPINLVPFVGPAARIRTAARAGIAAANVGAATAVEEAVLQEANLTRTTAESLLNIGGSAILGAGLGSLAARIDKGTFDKAVSELERVIVDPKTGTTDAEKIEFMRNSSPIGAQIADTIEARGNLENLAGLGRSLGQMSPVVDTMIRAQRSQYPLRVGAGIIQQFSTGGLRVSSPKTGGDFLSAVAEGGQLEGRRNARERRLSALHEDIVRDAWIDHDGVRRGPFQELRAEASAIFSNSPLNRPRQLSFVEFNAELTRALHEGLESPYPEIEKAARRINAEIVQPITEYAQKAGLLPPDLDESDLKGALSYWMRIYDHEMIKRRPEVFVEFIVQNNLEKVNARFLKERKKVLEEGEMSKFEYQLRSIDDDAEAERMYRDIQGSLNRMSTGPQARAQEEVRRLREQEKELKAQAAAAREGGDETEAARLEGQIENILRDIKERSEANNLSQFKLDKRQLERARRALNSRLSKLTTKQAKAIDDADKIRNMMLKARMQSADRIRKLMAEVDNFTDENINKVTQKLAAEIEKLDQLIENGEARLASIARKNPEIVDMPEEWTRRVQRFKLGALDELIRTRPDLVEKGPKGEVYLKVQDDDGRKAVVEALDALLDEGEYKALRDDGTLGFVEFTPQQAEALKKWRDELDAMTYTDPAKLEAAEVRFHREVSRQVKRQSKQDGLIARLKNIESQDWEAVQRQVEDRLQDYVERQTDIDAKRAVREQKLRDKARYTGMVEYDEWYKEMDELKARPQRLIEGFEEKMIKGWGAEDVDVQEGVLDIRRTLEADAKHIRKKILGELIRAPNLDIWQEDARGPALARVLDIPYSASIEVDGEAFTWSDFMVKDVAATGVTYIKTMTPDSELALRFGSPSTAEALARLEAEASAYLKNIEEDLDQFGEPLPEPRSRKEKEALSVRVRDDLETAQKAINVTIDRFRHRDGLPEDPTSFLFRTARWFRHAQVPLYMGAVTIASLPEFARPVFRYGVINGFGDSYGQLTSDFRGFLTSAEEMYRAGQGLDANIQTRLNAIWDIGENPLYRTTRLEKVTEYLAMKTGTVGLFSRQTQLFKMIVAPAAEGEMWRSLEVLMDPAGAKAQRRSMLSKDKAAEVLANAGVSEQMAERMWRQFQEHGAQRTGSGYLRPNYDLWTDIDALDVWRAHLSQELDAAIITPGLERPMWTTRNETARVVTQFRSFMFASNTKTLMAGVQQRDMGALTGVLLMLALGYVSWAARSSLEGFESDRWERFKNADFGKAVDEMIYHSGVLAAIGEAKDFASEIPGLRPWLNFSRQGPDRLGQPDLI
jgi:hypothetical protein